MSQSHTDGSLIKNYDFILYKGMSKSIHKCLKLLFHTFMRYFKFFYHPSSIAALFVNFWLTAACGGAALEVNIDVVVGAMSFTQECLF